MEHKEEDGKCGGANRRRNDIQEDVEAAEPAQRERDGERYGDEHGQIGAHFERHQIDVEKE